MPNSICPTAQALATPLFLRRTEGRYTVDPATGCWDWNLRLDKSGYGLICFKLGGRLRGAGAHRVSYMAHRGPIPVGLHIDHLCRNRKCVNPDHLEPVTLAENNRRSAFRVGRARNRSRTPLDQRPGCHRHGKQDGCWFKYRGRDHWRCRACLRIRAKARTRRLRENKIQEGGAAK